ncbi:hypothetical protein DYB37_009926 [Aphanomyces astaci]|uniref:PH domain-containing protein n=1 Tax=Aphanomyces astaci TaxID=112090 RepID=A0A3L6VKY7_APHAT|nr:hypothetical protein AaE_012614 [Aphanomyces astaci]RHY98169.1 hypothetical protein DYB35_009034 [Aphanomyces astaci]RHZ24504.1 hypothetical protein DYB37_009926 [Aphanomyces astaci]RLO09416.1 hypothetical protein DYB28_010787 [Aphanomyces astaci]
MASDRHHHDPPPPLRCGMLYKKGQKTALLGRANWKRRYIELTPDAILYYTDKGGELKGTIDLTQCTAKDIQAMPRDCVKTGRSPSSVWRIAIRTPARRFVMAANTPSEMNQWFHDLIRIVQYRTTALPSSTTNSDVFEL